MFIGGIVQVVQTITTDVNALQIAIGAARIFFAGFVGYTSALVFVLFGQILLKK